MLEIETLVAWGIDGIVAAFLLNLYTTFLLKAIFELNIYNDFKYFRKLNCLLKLFLRSSFNLFVWLKLIANSLRYSLFLLCKAS